MNQISNMNIHSLIKIGAGKYVLSKQSEPKIIGPSENSEKQNIDTFIELLKEELRTKGIFISSEIKQQILNYNLTEILQKLNAKSITTLGESLYAYNKEDGIIKIELMTNLTNFNILAKTLNHNILKDLVYNLNQRIEADCEVMKKIYSDPQLFKIVVNNLENIYMIQAIEKIYDGYDSELSLSLVNNILTKEENLEILLNKFSPTDFYVTLMDLKRDDSETKDIKKRIILNEYNIKSLLIRYTKGDEYNNFLKIS